MKRDGEKPINARRVAENKLYDQQEKTHNTNGHSERHSSSSGKTLGHAAGEYEELSHPERRQAVPRKYEGSQGKSVFGTQPFSEFSQQSTFGKRPVRQEPEELKSNEEINQNVTYNKDEKIMMENELRAMDEFKNSFFVRRI